MTPDEQVEALAGVLAAHDAIGYDDVEGCECGNDADVSHWAAYHAHVARAILTSDAFRALVAGERAAALREAADVVRRTGSHIGHYRTAQTAIGDMDRERIDVLEVGSRLSALRRSVCDDYERAIERLIEGATE